MSEQPVRLTGRLVFGLVIITLGVLFTLDNLGVLDSGMVLRWWPIVPLTYGLLSLAGIAVPRRYPLGVVLTLAGTFLLLHNVGMLAADPWDFWPVMLIVLGVGLVMRSLNRTRISAEGEDPSSTMSAFALWSGITRKVTSQAFRGGDVTAIMGGHVIDLKGSKLEGGRAILDLFVWWGGVEIRIPENWKVTMDGMALMGGIEDVSKAPVGEPTGTLVLKGLVVMGGVEIKN